MGAVDGVTAEGDGTGSTAGTGAASGIRLESGIGAGARVGPGPGAASGAGALSQRPEVEKSAFKMRCASRWPLQYAPCTVWKYVAEVASPANSSLPPATGSDTTV